MVVGWDQPGAGKSFRAPAKELVYFERSGHNPGSTKSELFVREVLRLTGGD